MASITSYRSQPTQQSSDSDSSASDDDQPWKRQKKSKNSKKETPMVVSVTKSKPPASVSKSYKRKRNNVWGDVVQEQAEEEVARDITQFDMYMSKERDVESYNFRLEESKHLPLGNPINFEKEVNTRNRKVPEALGGDDDAWLVEDQREVKGRLGSRNDVLNAKDRLGTKEEHQDTNMKFIEINPDMHKMEVAGKISYSLQEPKRDMVKTVVNEIGIEKSIAVWKKTGDIEKTGGMMVHNGSRRRTSGGVFFQLLKTDLDISKSQKDTIFAMSTLQSNQESRKTRRRKRKRKHASKMEVDAREDKTRKSSSEGSDKDDRAQGDWGNIEVKAQEEVDMNIACLFQEHEERDFADLGQVVGENSADKGQQERKMMIKEEPKMAVKEEPKGDEEGGHIEVKKQNNDADMEEGEISD